MRQNLWAPWRMEYIRQLTSDKGKSDSSSSACFLCDACAYSVETAEGRQRLVLLNDDRGVILLNRYPYTNGHVLVACSEHVGDLTDLSPQQRAGIIELAALAEQTIRTAVNPQGINIGINLGQCAGAGLPGHLHVHVVPRWSGDTNFMQTVGQVRVIPDALEQSYEQLAEALVKAL